MAGVTISYNGNQIAEISATGTKTLQTEGKYCTDDINVVYTAPNITSLTVTPTESQQVFNGDVQGNKIVDKSFTSSGTITISPSLTVGDTYFWEVLKYTNDGFNLWGDHSGSFTCTTSEQETDDDVYISSSSIRLATSNFDFVKVYIYEATIVDGYLPVTVNAMPSGSAFTPAVTITAAPTISVNANGLVTATNAANSSVTPTISSGYISSGTAGTISVAGSKTYQLTSKTAFTYTPTTTDQTIASGQYLTGVQTIKGDANLIGENIKSGVSIFGVNGTAEGGEYFAPVYKNLALRSTISYSGKMSEYLDQLASVSWGMFAAATFDSYITQSYTWTNVSIVRPSAFAMCNLQQAVFPSCKSIMDHAFANCSKLTTASFPSCTYISSYVFQNCTSLTTISFPVCTTIGVNAFNSCTSLTTISFPACTNISTGAFWSCMSLTTISFPECTNIGGNAFNGCTSLITISFPKCTSIGSSAFIGCTKLSVVNFPVCTYISINAFNGCTSLTTISFPSCTSIGDTAFRSCTSLTTASFPVCTRVGSYTFNGCTKLSIISFPECTTIGSGAFSNCMSLTTINFPKCTSIGNTAFSNCTSLTTASFPVCTSIGNYIFMGCTDLTTVSFPACTSIGDYTFNGCKKLTTVSFSSCTRIGNYTFSGCTSLSTVSFPVCTNIGSSAFNGCTSLTTASFPECTYIGSFAFAKCTSLTTASFPVCTYIGSYGFEWCTSLSEVYFMGSEKPIIGTNIFSYTPMKYSSYLGYFGSIYVPSSLVNSYKTATNWTAYSSRIVGI